MTFWSFVLLFLDLIVGGFAVSVCIVYKAWHYFKGGKKFLTLLQAGSLLFAGASLAAIIEMTQLIFISRTQPTGNFDISLYLAFAVYGILWLAGDAFKAALELEDRD